MDEMMQRHQEKVQILKQQNQELKDGSNENRALLVQGSEQMLSDQLKEMTAVLEEFDHKYSRKEKQLDVARNQNAQLKDAFDKLRDIQTKIQG